MPEFLIVDILAFLALFAPVVRGVVGLFAVFVVVLISLERR